MNILVISGSTRRESLNTRLARQVAMARPDAEVTVHARLAELPFFDADMEAAGTPTAVGDLRTAVEAADLVVVSTPEYNGTIPGVLGNAIDWLSRPAGQSVLNGKDVVVISASPGQGGGRRAAAHAREVLSRLGAIVAPDGLSVARAYDALSPEALPEVREQLAGLLDLVLRPAA